MKNIYSPSYYQILEVTPSVKADQIKASYRRLIKMYHEDKNPGDPSAKEKSQMIIEAHEILSSIDKREKYDTNLQIYLKEVEEKKRKAFQEAFHKQRAAKQESQRVVQKPIFNFGAIAALLLVVIFLLALSSNKKS